MKYRNYRNGQDVTERYYGNTTITVTRNNRGYGYIINGDYVVYSEYLYPTVTAAINAAKKEIGL